MVNKDNKVNKMSRIFVIIDKKEEKITYSKDGVNFIRSTQDLDLNEQDIFVSYINETTIELRIDEWDIPADSLCIVTKNKDLDNVLDNEEYNYEQDYYLFSGQKIKGLETETKKDIIRSMKTLATAMYQMLAAGYLQEEDNKKIDDWIPSFEEPTLKLLGKYLKFETSNPDKNIEDEFLINPQFRKMILLNIMQILANYIVNNEMIKVDEVAKIGNWTDEKTWEKLNKKLKLFRD